MTIDPNEYQLPCDVKLPPATRIKRGCTLNTLLVAMQQRESFPPAERVFNDATPPAAQVQGEREEFEAAFSKIYTGETFLVRHSANPDSYRNGWVQEQWEGWQLRAALSAPHEQAELWAVHVEGPDDLYAAFSREDAERHANGLNAITVPDGISISAVVIPSPWGAVEHWQYLAEQEREHVESMRAALSAPPAAGVPEGYVLAPIKPTIEMVAAGYEASLGQPDRSAHARVIEQYDAMLAEAPPPPASEQQSAVVMPERKKHVGYSGCSDTFDGWNRCIDEFIRLNPQVAVIPVAILISALERTRDTVDAQRELIAARAKGAYLDKAPVMRSLLGHRMRCDEALAEYKAEFLRLNPNLQPAAPSQGGE